MNRNEYRAAHKAIVRVRGKASSHKCVMCGGQAHDWAYKNPSDFSHDPDDYLPMCRSCHFKMDRSLYETCTVNGCEKPHQARGLCGTHLQRFYRNGDIDARAFGRTSCQVEGCLKPHHSRDLCEMHYRRELRQSRKKG